MRVLLFTSNYKPRINGISTYGYEASLALKERRHVPVVLAFGWRGGGAFDRMQPFQTLRLPGPFWFQAICSFVVLPIIAKKYHIQAVLNLMWFPCGLVSIFVSFLLDVPSFVVVHGREVYLEGRSPKKCLLAFGAPIQRFVFNHAAGVFPVSRSTKALLLRNRTGMEHVSVVHNGVNVSRFSPTAAPRLTPELRAAIQGKHVLLTVGRLGMRKGHDNVIRALPRVLSQIPNTIYLIAGSGIEETEVYCGKVIESLISEHQLHSFIRMLGEVNDDQLVALYNACSVLVMPSREIPEMGDIEGFGITYLEANACGKPVIAGKSGGVPDAVEDGVTGILVNPESPEEIAQAIVKLLANPRLRQRMGRAGRDRAVSSFQWAHTADRLVERMLLWGNVDELRHWPNRIH